MSGVGSPRFQARWWPFTMNSTATSASWCARTMALRAHAPANALRYYHHMCGDRIINVREVIDVSPGNHGALAGGEWPQRHERQYELVFMDQTDWRATRDDFTKDAGHG